MKREYLGVVFLLMVSIPSAQASGLCDMIGGIASVVPAGLIKYVRLMSGGAMPYGIEPFDHGMAGGEHIEAAAKWTREIVTNDPNAFHSAPMRVYFTDEKIASEYGQETLVALKKYYAPGGATKRYLAMAALAAAAGFSGYEVCQLEEAHDAKVSVSNEKFKNIASGSITPVKAAQGTSASSAAE